MRYSLTKSFRSRRQNETNEEDHVYPRLDPNGFSTSNSNLVKKEKKSKSFLRRTRRYSSSPPPAPSSQERISKSINVTKSKSKTLESGYSSHVNEENDDGDDDPFSKSSNPNNRTRPLGRLTSQIRKSFRNTLTRQRPRLESTNSNKRLIFNSNENQQNSSTVISPISTGITSQIISPPDACSPETTQKPISSKKRRRAPLAPSHIQQSQSVPNTDCSTLIFNENQESGYGSSPNENEKANELKKSKSNQSLRSRISMLLKKRQEKHQQIPNSIDEELDHQTFSDDHEQSEAKKVTFGQRFDNLRRSLHLGKRNSPNKGKGHLLLNE